MDPASSIVTALATLSLLSAGTYGEFDFNAQPSVFPPVDGFIERPDRAQGYYQGGDLGFQPPLTAAELEIWEGLTPAQQARAATFIRNGGTLVSSLGSDF